MKVAVMLRDTVGIAGAASISYGCWLAYAPLGFIVGGSFALTAAVLSAMVKPRDLR